MGARRRQPLERLRAPAGVAASSAARAARGSTYGALRLAQFAPLHPASRASAKRLLANATQPRRSVSCCSSSRCRRPAPETDVACSTGPSIRRRGASAMTIEALPIATRMPVRCRAHRRGDRRPGPLPAIPRSGPSPRRHCRSAVAPCPGARSAERRRSPLDSSPRAAARVADRQRRGDRAVRARALPGGQSVLDCASSRAASTQRSSPPTGRPALESMPTLVISVVDDLVQFVALGDREARSTRASASSIRCWARGPARARDERRQVGVVGDALASRRPAPEDAGGRSQPAGSRPWRGASGRRDRRPGSSPTRGGCRSPRSGAFPPGPSGARRVAARPAARGSPPARPAPP